jgi:hypothetical protein
LSTVVAVLVAATAAGCLAKPLPEEGSPSALLYVEKCGTYCHRPYQPVALKPKMWETMVARMEIEMVRRGMPFSARDRAEILDYLSRNAGTM